MRRKTQKIIVQGVLIAVLLCFYPPWVKTSVLGKNTFSETAVSHYFIFSPPKSKYEDEGYKVDSSRLIIYFSAIFLVTCGRLFLANKTHESALPLKETKNKEKPNERTIIDPNKTVADEPLSPLQKNKYKNKQNEKTVIDPNKNAQKPNLKDIIKIISIVCFIFYGIYFLTKPLEDQESNARQHAPVIRDKTQRTTSKIPKLAPSLLDRLEFEPARPLPTRQPPDQCAPLALPSNGIIKKNFNTGLAPLNISTKSGIHYYIKIFNSKTGDTALTAFIHGGKKIETKLPLGDYKIKYATGKDWCGKNQNLLFGEHTSTYILDKVFSFNMEQKQYERYTQNRYEGHTIELYLQIGGNLRSRQIDRSNF
jgi:hypothetical protein